MLKKSRNPLNIETKEYRVFNPANVKQTVEVPFKEKSIEEIEKIETTHGTDEKGNTRLVIPKTTKKSPKRSKKQAATAKNLKRTVKKSNFNFKPTNAAEFKEKKLKKDGYSLIITEKPQAAQKIAAALSNGKDKKISRPGGVSYYELDRNNKNVVVACAVGHLFSVSQTVKSNSYPIFDIGWFPNYEIRKNDFTKKYYAVIQSLVKNASEIIIATDFDVEGEVIGYNILRFIAGQHDARRMKFSSLTTKELQDAFDNSYNTIEWGQAIAGETRHFLDWLYGINLSRALMQAIRSTGKFKIMSIGRVQGPALKLIVDKERIIEKFKPEPYWQVFITINDNKNVIELKYNKDLTKKGELSIFEKLKGRQAQVSTTKKKQIIPPPAPFDLTTLQTESYKFHGITPSQTLAIAQKLYLAGLISYPRTSSQKIPEAANPKDILKKLSKKFPSLTKHATKDKPVEGKKTDPAHPAIMPTGNFETLEGRDEKIYTLIVKRFISCFCSNAQLEDKKIEAVVDDLKFSTKGMEFIDEGWILVYPVKMEEREIPDMNEPALIEKVKIEEKMTQPPRRFSPASIVTELEKRNLGTKATRANILETLYDRDYIEGNQIKATELGKRLIESLEKHSPIIIDEKLTRNFEKDLDHIRESKKQLNEKQSGIIKKAHEALKNISTDFKTKESEIGKELVSANQAIWDQQKENNKLEINCPECKTGHLGIRYSPRFKSYFIGCDSYPDCKKTFPLPSNSLIKKHDKNCPYCNYPQLIRIKKGKRPWIFCFNPKCESRKQLDANGNTQSSQARYVGK